jgi:hypothetical protein
VRTNRQKKNREAHVSARYTGEGEVATAFAAHPGAHTLLQSGPPEAAGFPGLSYLVLFHAYCYPGGRLVGRRREVRKEELSYSRDSG